VYSIHRNGPGSRYDSRYSAAKIMCTFTFSRKTYCFGRTPSKHPQPTVFNIIVILHDRFGLWVSKKLIFPKKYMCAPVIVTVTRIAYTTTVFNNIRVLCACACLNLLANFNRVIFYYVLVCFYMCVYSFCAVKSLQRYNTPKIDLTVRL
jgi:hypothetical protein